MKNTISMLVVFFLFLVGYISVRLLHRKKKERIRKAEQKGIEGEKELVKTLYRVLPVGSMIYNNLYIETSFRRYTQIDAVAITPWGILVIEMKNYNGLIRGDARAGKWIQQFGKGRNIFRFYNPIKQNETHVSVLRNIIKRSGGIPFYSIVVFGNGATLGEIENIPPYTCVTTLINLPYIIGLIAQTGNQVRYYSLSQMRKTLEKAQKNGERKWIAESHNRNIKKKKKRI